MAKKGRKNKRGCQNGTSKNPMSTPLPTDSDIDEVASSISFARSTSEIDSERDHNSDYEEIELSWIYQVIDEKIDEIMDRRLYMNYNLWVEKLNNFRQKVRARGLSELREILTKNFLDEELKKRSETLFSALLHLVKRGSSILEKSLGAKTLALTILQFCALDCFTDQMNEAIFDACIPCISDRTIDASLRCDYITLLTCTVLIDGENYELTRDLATKLYHIFLEESIHDLQITALTCWSILLNECLMEDARYMTPLVREFIAHSCKLMDSPSIELRVVVGEALCIVAELNESILSETLAIPDKILDAVSSLSTESTKKISKKDRCQQHASFRKIRKYLEGGEFISNEVILNGEYLKINCWTKTLHYNFFNQILESMFSDHVKYNSVIRSIFGLSDVPLMCQKFGTGERQDSKLLHRLRSTYRSKHIGSLRNSKWEAFGLNDLE